MTRTYRVAAGQRSPYVPEDFVLAVCGSTGAPREIGPFRFHHGTVDPPHLVAHYKCVNGLTRTATLFRQEGTGYPLVTLSQELTWLEQEEAFGHGPFPA